MNALDEKGLIDKSTRKDLLENKVVLIVPKDSELSLNDLLMWLQIKSIK